MSLFFLQVCVLPVILWFLFCVCFWFLFCVLFFFWARVFFLCVGFCVFSGGFCVFLQAVCSFFLQGVLCFCVKKHFSKMVLCLSWFKGFVCFFFLQGTLCFFGVEGFFFPVMVCFHFKWCVFISKGVFYFQRVVSFFKNFFSRFFSEVFFFLLFFSSRFFFSRVFFKWCWCLQYTHLVLSTSHLHNHLYNNNKELALWHSHHPAWMGVSHRWVPV